MAQINKSLPRVKAVSIDSSNARSGVVHFRLFLGNTAERTQRDSPTPLS